MFIRLVRIAHIIVGVIFNFKSFNSKVLNNYLLPAGVGGLIFSVLATIVSTLSFLSAFFSTLGISLFLSSSFSFSLSLSSDVKVENIFR